MVHYMTDKYNEPLYKVDNKTFGDSLNILPLSLGSSNLFFFSFRKPQVPVNIFHFSRSPGDFSVYDISACYEDHSKLHLMVMLGCWLCGDKNNILKILVDIDIDIDIVMFHR